MDNQHLKISGYRELTADEIALINCIRAHGDTLEDTIKALESIPETDKHCTAIAKENLQQGIMWLVRAIAKPDGFDE